jgi:NAD(P)-dependent dehydrogenase (short-subunit alcohol dehydrogenase family)
VHYHSSDAAAREVARRVDELGRQALLVAGDLGRPEDVTQVARAVAGRFGRLDLLVNSAASFEEAELLEVDAAAWDRVMALNLRAPFLLVRAAAELLRASQGTVVNVLDLGAVEPWTHHPHHSVSKAALLHLTKVLARVLAPQVRVNAVAPGSVLLPEGLGDEFAEREKRRTPLGRIGSTEDVLRTVLFLAASPFITGEVIVVDGGRSLA